MINRNASNSNRKGARIARKTKNVSKDIPTKKRSTRAFKREFPFSVQISNGSAEIALPIRTISEANCFEHWRKSHKRHTIQRKTVALALNPIKDKIKLPCSIKLIRYAPRTLDKFENLPMSFKYIVDACCAIITGDFRAGRADGDERISLSCDQVKSEGYGIKIIIIF
jgi:hypothetical protein